MALQSNALLTVDELKAALLLTTSVPQPQLEDLINKVSDGLESWTGRRLRSRAYTNLYLPIRSDRVLRSREWLDVEWPITALTSLSIDGEDQSRWFPGDAGTPDDFDVYVLEG